MVRQLCDDCFHSLGDVRHTEAAEGSRLGPTGCTGDRPAPRYRRHTAHHFSADPHLWRCDCDHSAGYCTAGCQEGCQDVQEGPCTCEKYSFLPNSLSSLPSFPFSLTCRKLTRKVKVPFSLLPLLCPPLSPLGPGSWSSPEHELFHLPKVWPQDSCVWRRWSTKLGRGDGPGAARCVQHPLHPLQLLTFSFGTQVTFLFTSTSGRRLMLVDPSWCHSLTVLRYITPPLTVFDSYDLDISSMV